MAPRVRTAKWAGAVGEGGSISLLPLHASRRRPRRILLSVVVLETNYAVSLESCKRAHCVD